MAGEPDPDEEATSNVSASTEKQLPPPAVLEIEPVYEALGHSRRRYLCYTLLEDTEWSLTDLATKIAAWENDVSEHEVTENQRDRVYVSLYHAHVPKLVDESVITFDEATETITTAEHAEQVMTALEGLGASLDANQETHARSEMDE
ncbi:DUF7344 domain-containing protein [Natrarchaeobius chitinivorans]|uniref:DUF7344 domain-containing protein n=1 Tax=Natrarchaeobius chitinivorans TaxID=1679083 RepID=A0A3N6LWQ4_NATCH|nr:hypothetical protein [Natrarchaeobius chitinivorans]RQG95098.1 hypothetical protein EA473_09095 [Natrarchaeobius chitinivorans]